MSRIGKLPIEIPEGVNIKIDDDKFSVSGPKGELSGRLPEGINVIKEKDRFLVKVNKSKSARSIHGTIRASISNMIKGVSEHYSKTLEMVGTGYRGEVTGNILSLSIGYSHPVRIEAPEGISFKVEKNDISVSGADKELVGEIASEIRAIRPPEPYTGKRHADGPTIRRSPPGAPRRAGARGPGRRDHGYFTGMFSVSDEGVFVYRTASAPGTFQPTWVDRQGETVGTFGPPGTDRQVVLSPDGARAVAKDAPYNVPGDLWMLDLASDRRTRFTFRRNVYSPAVWSPDGTRVAYSAGRGDTIYEKPASGLGDEQVLLKEPGLRHFPTSWSRDGQRVPPRDVDRN